jgi:hypothetical protein
MSWWYGPGSSVGIATDYGLDGLGIESQWGARFFAHVQTGPEAHPASCTMGTGSFLRVKRPGCGADHPPPSSAEVEKEYSYTSTHPLGHFRPVMGQLYLRRDDKVYWLNRRNGMQFDKNPVTFRKNKLPPSSGQKKGECRAEFVLPHLILRKTKRN